MEERADTETFYLKQDSAALCLDKIASVWVNACEDTTDVPSFGFMILCGYFRPHVYFRERSFLTIIVQYVNIFLGGSDLLLGFRCVVMPFWCKSLPVGWECVLHWLSEHFFAQERGHFALEMGCFSTVAVLWSTNFHPDVFPATQMG